MTYCIKRYILYLMYKMKEVSRSYHDTLENALARKQRDYTANMARMGMYYIVVDRMTGHRQGASPALYNGGAE